MLHVYDQSHDLLPSILPGDMIAEHLLKAKTEVPDDMNWYNYVPYLAHAHKMQ